ncbi:MULTISPECIES: ECA polysaccharide chain length modulation protein [Erwinia]|uniref:ECA polysaccharide chain length modulation protein n=1 Tax=Erwinia rhapontici TaxID=55212 RepID=A0ABM7N6I6_ERWRD|nr:MULTISPECIES: ECA polysaccharide chain length modulation protein [Erwinia]MBP2153158.1 lipopolysaccharide biosynthesis protein WzzE [Erwinia rhapontici]MCS3610002.1 lipopolysaccharide biosynthesis protein WzzE [Erwinia rhapontici]NKG32667.1 ECA polysaccharide chain length modulation protein [Erwinia rhapontici]NNS09826.1 ECA polysaccharide chain length modulation protein [Erwinia sp. JH02]TDS89618.1 lipopolysaccharide biosynthesis protein WzzE [Erwinia rhapontici]
MTYPDAADNELDIRGLCCTLWRGKLWIIAGGVLFALLAWIYSLLVTPKWSTTAIVDRPTVNMLSGFYSQQQFLNNLDIRAGSLTVAPPTVMDEAYQEFMMQLFAWDTRRDFWLQSSYYQQRKSGKTGEDAALLDEMIANIQFQPADNAKNINDTVRLIAETAADANTLLRQYVAFANARATTHLNEELAAAWAARSIQLKAQIKRQEAVAKAIYDRQINSIGQALKIAQQQGFEQAKTQTPSEQLPDSEMFMLGRPMLQARLENLRATGPSYDLEYDQNRAMQATLNVGPTLVKSFQTWRYLRTPEEPVKRDSPRRVLLMIMWGTVGVLLGAGTALVRRSRR